MLTGLFGSDNPEPVYANDAQVTHNLIEFRLRFRFVGEMRAKAQAEVVMHPIIMKGLIELLQKEIATFEKDHGVIYLPTDVSGLEGLFKGPVHEETGE